MLKRAFAHSSSFVCLRNQKNTKTKVITEKKAVLDGLGPGKIQLVKHHFPTFLLRDHVKKEKTNEIITRKLTRTRRVSPPRLGPSQWFVNRQVKLSIHLAA